MKTRGGVFLNLEESTYTYKFKNFKLVFSSLFNKERFINGINAYLLQENIKISKRFGYNIDISNVLILKFYERLEKRGFLVYYKNEKIAKTIKFNLNF